MRELQQRQKFKKRLYSMPSLLILAILVLLSIKGTWNVLEKRRESQHFVNNLTNQAESLKKRQSELEKDLEYLKTEEGIDQEIKERFNVAKPGEEVVVIVEPKNTASSSNSSLLPWYKRFWNAIIHSR